MIPNSSETPARFQNQEEINLYEYIAVLLRRRKIFLWGFSTVFILAILYTFLMKPVYEASSMLHVKDEKSKAGILGELSLSTTNPVNTEIEILKSRTNAENVVKRLHLNWEITKKSKGLTFSILEFKSDAEEPLYKIELTGAQTYKVTDDDGKTVGEGKSGVLMQKEGFRLLLDNIKGEAGNSFRVELLSADQIVQKLREEIKASEAGRLTSIIKVSYQNTDPVLARDVVNTLVQSYLEQSVGFKSEEAGRAVGFVEEQLDTLRGELDKAEKNLQTYKSATGVMMLDSEAEALIQTIAAKEKANAELEVQKRALLSEYTEAHPAVKAINRQQEAIRKQLASYEAHIRTMPQAERDLAKLTRISKVNADIYTFLLQKHEEARIAQASTLSNINIVDPAITPEKPVKPKKKQYLLLGLLLAMGLGVGLAFLQEYLDDTIKSADEAKRVLGFPLLAIIPHITTTETKDNSPKNMLITKHEPKSAVAEAFRALRTSLHFSGISKENKIILVTSSFPQEGKSVISSNLSNVIAQTKARVLIIDCDLRRSSLHEKFGYGKTPGLSEILTGDITFAKAVHSTDTEGLDLITAGTNPPNPSELLGSEVMKQLIITQRKNYDFILIDAPPVMAVSDAPVLTSVCDLAVLVVEAGRVPVKIAQRMREMLITIKAPVAGIVFNDKSGKGETYEYYGSRYYGKGYGYGYYSDENGNGKSKSTIIAKLMPEKKGKR
ncbi:MAG TPA: polysaccharide biosynthesis tyrosine autokinase [Smithellaceae bacterium]|jgi:tyrosine-protein kinase Etk/Wzc|nr:polysaccharide biosynthesis tyrosine autokinase [Smithellaceae bacterium]